MMQNTLKYKKENQCKIKGAKAPFLFVSYQQLTVVNECPMCKSINVTILNRVCGYLGIMQQKGETRFNDSKYAEVKDRKSM